MTAQEKKDKKFSLIVSLIIHSSLLLALFFLIAWRAPDPPLPEYGIELNLGFQAEGSGETERETETLIEDTQDAEAPDAQAETENTQTEEENTVTEETAEAEEVVKEQVEEQKVAPLKEVIEETKAEEVVEKAVTQEEVAEVAVEKAEEVKKEVEEEKQITSAIEEAKKEETEVEKKKEEEVKPKPKPVIDNRALMGGKKTDTKNQEEASNNQGSTTDKKGNEGDPEGEATATGKTDGGADMGVSYSLDGWKWQSPPTEKDDSQVDGIIKFSISVDDRGKVIAISIVPGTTISDNTIVDFYKKQVLGIRFLQTDATKAPAPISKGEVTFVIKTN